MILAIIGIVTASVRLDELSVRYGDTLALDRITAEIPAGRSVAVVGVGNAAGAAIKMPFARHW